MNDPTTDTAALPQDGQEHRLHPLSWLFVLIAQLKNFIPALIVLLFAGRGDQTDLYGLIAVVVLVAVSLAQYFTYRYLLRGDAIVIRSGWLHRSVREIPYARIHNVNLHQSLLHRLFGVAEVRLESAGGIKPEAQMRVLRLDQAEALEALIRQRGHATSNDAPQVDALEAAPLLAMSNAEVLRLGLISNRGMLVVAAAFGALAQTGDNVFGVLIDHWGEVAFGWFTGFAGAHADDNPVVVGLAVASLVLVALLLVRLLSVLLAFLQYHGFTLREDDARIRVERGLLARTRSSAKRRRIQSWSLHEGVLHRWFDRRSLRVQTASGQRGEGAQQSLKELAPIATPAHCDALIQHFLPAAGWDALHWRPLHRHAWWRIAVPGVLMLLAGTAVLTWHFGLIGLAMPALLPLQLWRARRIADACGHACNDQLVAWRSGWLSKTWNFAEIGKIQAVRLAQSPLDRRLGMASLLLDTAGASPFGAPLYLRQLPVDVARDLSARLLGQLARRRP
ncbi:PH domain-containing protein [Thermomonas carbonis]|uniref:PH domain-containing protein n=1 Tax=Thermomonas carbonis TaxID=1463158 RepID=A0A7G9STJ7_9GAMM|nr:PH domain-containing protein [Thermomonas carbonis]QNN71172.1 PH domain-containing protein [Thermomonas carbonis]GHC11479.1 membrane protein [Thermomonas carbonis]